MNVYVRVKYFVINKVLICIHSRYNDLPFIVTVVTWQKLNLEQFFQLHLLWAKLDYLHLKNKCICLMVSHLKPHSNWMLTEGERAQGLLLMAAHTINCPVKSQGSLKWLRAVFFFHTTLSTNTQWAVLSVALSNNSSVFLLAWCAKKQILERLWKVHTE